MCLRGGLLGPGCLAVARMVPVVDIGGGQFGVITPGQVGQHCL